MADLSPMNAKLLAEFDRSVQELRAWYDSATSEERDRVAQWVSDLAAVEDRNPNRSLLAVGVSVANLETDSEGDIVRAAITNLAPKAILGAISAWDVGREFVPAHWMETM